MNQYKHIDSMGGKCGNKRKNKIRRVLMSIDLATKDDSWATMDTRLQTEHECGIRMVIYMTRIKQWAMAAQGKPYDVARRMKWFINEEERNKGDIAAEYRKELYGALTEEERKIGG